MKQKANRDWLLMNDLEQQKVNLKFLKNAGYSISTDSVTIRQGENWGIVNDGQYLYLDSILNGSSYIKIMSLDTQNLVIGYNTKFKHTKSDRSHSRETITMELEKI
ncbi:MAG: hypothetical protein P1U56_00870 [Saprospiraceae bacterium]|nr:hypothetical protein [Saprospiraceae bacterium]